MIGQMAGSLIALIALQAAAGSAPLNPAMAQFGRVVLLPNAAMQPDPTLDYKVAFNITKAASAPDKINPGLEKLARYVRLLAASGIRPPKGKIVAVVHGKATDLALNKDAYRKRHAIENPNLDPLHALLKMGVEIHICGQALAAQKITPEDVSSGVIIDLSALVTLTTLQLRGWAVVNE